MNYIKNDIKTKVLIAGGGTGGHIFPALAIAEALKNKNPYIEFLFVGSKHKMEMQRIREAGYAIIGLDIIGLYRKNILKNFSVFFKLIRSFFRSYRILKTFKPSIVVGVGGYSSFPIIFIAQILRIPTVIQEQNSYAGLSNRILGKYATIICTGYKNMKKFFKPSKTIFTGNPVRPSIYNVEKINNAQMKVRFGLDDKKHTVLIIGGSQGSVPINNFIAKNLDFFTEKNLQLIWQTGKKQYKKLLSKIKQHKNIHLTDFIYNIENAYAAADIIVSRAGALSIAELSVVGKPVIFIPFPYATANHQYHNAHTLQEGYAAMLIEQKEITTQLLPNIESLIKDKDWQMQLSEKIKTYAYPHASNMIAEQILKIVHNNAPLLKKVYMIGIGGSGMRSLAHFLSRQNVQVKGYDKTATIHTQQLEQKGIKISYEENIENIDKNIDWIIYTPAVKNSNKELTFAKTQEKDIPLLKRSFVLGHITRTDYNICIGGTHGKTTSSAMTAKILQHGHIGANEFIGGEIILSDQNDTNPKTTNNTINIIEADEYDKSFLTLSPNIIAITNMEADHLDIYKTTQQMYEAYYEFVNQLKPDGILILPNELSKKHAFKPKHTITYGIQDTKAHIYTDNLEIKTDSVGFDVYIQNILYSRFTLKPTGIFNIENALIALIIAYILEIPKHTIQEALSDFHGVRRRFEIIFNNTQTIYIDDYAHHPTEITSCLDSIIKTYPKKKITAIFQPHLFSRTRDFQKEFAQALSLADDVILLPIYPARENPIKNVDSSIIAQHISKKCQIFSPEQTVEYIKTKIHKPEILVTIGAGDIDRIVPVIKELLEKNQIDL